MLKQLFIFTFCIISFGTISSCKRQNRVKTPAIVVVDTLGIEPLAKEITKKDTVEIIAPKIEKLEIQPAELDFKYLNMKSKVNFISSGEEQNFPVNIHIKKDSIIWLSIVVGLEGARGIITKDSVMFLDRLHRTYYKYDFAGLSKLFHFDLNYGLVESLLIGNLPIKKREQDMVVRKDSNYVISQQENFLKIDNLISGINFKLKNVNVKDSSGTNEMEINYSNFFAIDKFLIPQEIKARIEALKSGKAIKTSIQLQHNKIEVLEQSPGFNFTIPASYTRK